MSKVIEISNSADPYSIKSLDQLADSYRDLYDFAQGLGEVQINRTQNASFKLLVDEHQGNAGGNPGVFSANINSDLQIWSASSPLPGDENESSEVAWARESYDQYQESFTHLEGEIDTNSAPVDIIILGENLQQFKTICEEFVNQCKESVHGGDEI